jgi:hypothetical protein
MSNSTQTVRATVCGFRWSDGLSTPGHGTHRCGGTFMHPGAHVCGETVRDDRLGNPLARPQSCGALRRK